jgi:hypothetical protein
MKIIFKEERTDLPIGAEMFRVIGNINHEIGDTFQVDSIYTEFVMTDAEKTHLVNSEAVWKEKRLDAYARLVKTAVELNDDRRTGKHTTITL